MIKIDEKYTDYRDDTDPDYPGGKAVNASAGESTDGTPLLADWMNDINGARQALFVEAFGSISGVSNKPDNIKDSDVLKSIKKITESYTDKEIKKEAAQREQKDSDFFASAKSYVDGKIREEASVRSSEDSRILQSANTYTDRRISGEAASRKTEDERTLSGAKKYTDEMLIRLFSNACYVQYPWQPRPQDVFYFAGYRWAEVYYDGSFFRARGGKALRFGSGVQGDAIRNISGWLLFDSGNRILSSAGAFDFEESVTGGSWSTNSSWKQQVFTFDASRVVPTADENRPSNRTVVFWKLQKI